MTSPERDPLDIAREALGAMEQLRYALLGARTIDARDDLLVTVEVIRRVAQRIEADLRSHDAAVGTPEPPRRAALSIVDEPDDQEEG